MSPPSQSHSLRPLVLVAIAVALAMSACSGGQTGQGSGPLDCRESKTPLGLSEPGTSGFSADSLIQSTQPPRSGTLRFYQLAVTDTLTLSMASGGMAWQVTPGNDTHPICMARLEVAVTAAVVTDDGLLNEMMPGTLAAESIGNWRLQAEQSLSELNGSYDGSEFTLSNLKDPKLRVDVRSEYYGTGGGSGMPYENVSGTLWIVGDDPNPNDSTTPTTPAVGEWQASPGVSAAGGGAASGGGTSSGSGGSGGAL